MKFSKYAWRTKESIQTLADDNGTLCNTEDDKLRALVDRNFFTKDQEPLAVEADDREVGYTIEDLEERVRKALKGASNRSAPGPDRISYRVVKIVLDTKLGREIITEVATSLKEGRIPEEWQLPKVVLIPKPNKDYKAGRQLTLSTVSANWRRR